MIQFPRWSGSARWQKTVRSVRRGVVAVATIMAAYLALLLNPEVLLAHEIRVQNLGFHASRPFPAGTQRLLQQVLDRIQRSPFYDADDEYDVYLCSSPAEFALFARGQRNVGAISMVGLTGHAFVRPSAISENRLIGPMGQPIPGERDLAYFIAHELAHTMVARWVGRLEYLRLRVWQQEGYADVLAKERFDYSEALAAFRAKDRRLDPDASGLYLRYQLMFENQLRAGLSAEQLLSRPRDPAPVTAQLELEARALEQSE